MKGFKVEFGKGNTAGMAVYKDKKDAEAFAKRQPKPIKITQIDVKNANMFDDPEPTRKEEVELDEAMYHHVLKNKVVASGSKSDMMKLVKKNGATIRKGADSNYVLNSPGAKVGDIKEETLDEEVEDIFIKKGNVDDIARRVAKNARGLGLKAAVKGSVVRIKGAKKKVSDFLRITIGKTSSGDASTVGKVSSQDDSLLNLQFEEVNEMAYKPGSFKDTRPQEKGAKALADLAKTGGMDKKDFEKARSLYIQASDPASREKLKKFIFNLDTEPKEEIMNVIGMNDPETFLKMYPNAKKGQPLTTVSFAHRSMKSEEVELDEMDMKYVLINMQGKVQGYASDKKDALDIARRTKSTMHPIKKKISDKTLEKMNALSKTPKELQDLGIIEEVLPGHTVQSVEYKFKDKNEAMKAKKVLLKYFNSVLSESEFVAGDRYTFADIQMITTTDFFIGLNRLELKDYPEIKRHTKLMSQRESFSA